jgi:hypothetical protein
VCACELQRRRTTRRAKNQIMIELVWGMGALGRASGQGAQSLYMIEPGRASEAVDTGGRHQHGSRLCWCGRSELLDDGLWLVALPMRGRSSSLQSATPRLVLERA